MLLKPVILNCNNSSQHYSFYCIFQQTNAALEIIKAFFQKYEKKKKNLTKPKLLNGSISNK